MNKKTQHEKILNYLRKHREITPMSAFLKLHITKLATRVGEINKPKPRIYGRWIKTADSRCKAYWLKRAA